ncbi:hypothetical protein [Brevundimonas aurantiaca]|uniref:hypothetical protein n=1 Tax=Brevundimonas aurantiaca TaxID=74316 RepID=UPI001CD7C472|nr:hypothetical protein [Brevundimonas aurantiaca]
MSEPTDPIDPFPTRAQPPVSPFPPLEEPTAADPPSDWIDAADAHDLPTRENALVALGRFAFPRPAVGRGRGGGARAAVDQPDRAGRLRLPDDLQRGIGAELGAPAAAGLDSVND